MAHTAIKFDLPPRSGIMEWATFTFVNNTLFAVVWMMSDGPDCCALLLLTFGSELDEYPVS